MSHRTHVPNAPPPTPQGSSPENLLQYQRALNVWLQQMMTPIRGQLNWLVDQIGNRNLVPDSDLKDTATFWVVDPAWVVTDAAGWGGGKGFVLTAAAGTAVAKTIAIPVIPGDVYVLSGWLDCKTMTGGTVSWVLLNAADDSIILGSTLTQVLGNSERLEKAVQLPAGVTAVKVAVIAVNPVVPTGNVIASQPQLELPQQGHIGTATEPAASLYRANVGMP